MENLHLKNIKIDKSYIEKIKKTKWFNKFSKEQQYYIESGLNNNIDITSFAKKENSGNKMYDILTDLELKKYNEIITLHYYDWYNFYPDIDLMLNNMVNKI